MEIIVLASGSKGNATYIKSKETTLLIDAGISFRQINLRLEERKHNLEGLNAVFLTHEHSDHTRGLNQTIKRTGVPVYTGKKTYKSIRDILPLAHDHIPLEADRPFMFADLIITPIKTSHDAVESYGFIIQEGDKRLVYITDTGYLEETAFPKIKNAEIYIIEANYDVGLLFDSNRPYYLKKRIDSVKGHLSNDDAAYYLTRLVGDKTRTIILAHPSQECNTAACAMTTLDTVFKAYEKSLDPYDIVVASQHTPTKLIHL